MSEDPTCDGQSNPPPSPATKRAGLDGLRFHDLRLGHVAMLIDQGAHPRQISDRLGRESVKTVLDTYGHIMPGADAEIAAKLDKALENVDQTRTKAAGGEVVDMSDKREAPGGAWRFCRWR